MHRQILLVNWRVLSFSQILSAADVANQELPWAIADSIMLCGRRVQLLCGASHWIDPYSTYVNSMIVLEALHAEQQSDSAASGLNGTTALLANIP